MANQPGMTLFLIRLNSILGHNLLNSRQNLPVLLNAKQAVVILNNAMGSSGIKTGDYLVLLIHPKRKLRLIPVTPRILHPDYRLHDDRLSSALSSRSISFSIPNIFSCPRSLPRQIQVIKPANPLQIIINLSLFKLQLLLITHHLELAAAALARHRTALLHSGRGRLKYLHQSGKTVILLHFHCLCFNQVSDYGIFNKPDITIQFSYAFTTLAHILYYHFKDIILLDIHVYSLHSPPNRHTIMPCSNPDGMNSYMPSYIPSQILRPLTADILQSGPGTHHVSTANLLHGNPYRYRHSPQMHAN